MGWATFPVPTLTEQNKAALTRCAENILLAREAHFPATIADLYDPDAMPASRLGDHVRQLMARNKTHIVAMTGSYFRGDAEAVLDPDD